MDTIALVKNEQKKVAKRTRNIKKDIKSKNIIIRENVNKKKHKERNPKRKGKGKRLNASIYLGHIPHGFYEEQMQAYFSQFGKVISARLARSKKTGRSKGYGFVEFENKDVAKIAAETMDNYLMYNRVLKCKYIPPKEQKPTKLMVIDPLNYPRKQNRIIELKRKKSAMEKLNSATYRKKAQKKIQEFQKFFEEKGIKFSLNADNNGREDSAELTENSSQSTRSTNQNDEECTVLEIDESDSDIHFKTPPNVKKIFKKSIDTPVLNKSEAKSKIDKAKKIKLKASKAKSLVKQKLRSDPSKTLKKTKNKKDESGVRKKNNVEKSQIKKTRLQLKKKLLKEKRQNSKS